MKWFLTSAAAAAAPRAGVAALRTSHQTTESIRAAMVAAFAGADTPATRALLHRLRYAGDAERLWYLRPEAMSVLCALHGEARAREALARISAMFKDVLQDGLAAHIRTQASIPCAGPSGRRNHLKETA